jgi:hypothetical protein
MAKATKSAETKKITFGTRRKGKAKKSYSKYQQKPKPSVGQG